MVDPGPVSTPHYIDRDRQYCLCLIFVGKLDPQSEM